MPEVNDLDPAVLARMRERAADPEVQARLVDIIDRPPQRNHAVDHKRLAPSSRPRRHHAIAPPQANAEQEAEQRAARVDHAAVRFWVDHPDAELPDNTDDRATVLVAAGYLDEAPS